MRVDDETLAARAKDGDERTFEELALRYSDRLYAFCRARLGSENDAKDSAQDALVRAYRSLPSYDSSKPWSAWVFSIAANRVKSRYAAASSAERLALRVSAEQAVA
ncbi:MAG TPA: sigma factor, partial [Spirochaetales bacterium]|nr:sigma factor [Spirochaetales bacterium]